MTSRIKSENVKQGSSFVLPAENTLKTEETKLERMIHAAEIQKQKLITEGQKKAEEITAQANELVEQAHQLVEQAKLECQNLVAEAKKEAEVESDKIKEQANKEGYDAGYKQGYDDGTKSLEEKVLAVETFTKSQYDIKHNIVKSAELDIVELVIAIARKVCKKTLDNDIEVLKSITKDAINQLKDKEDIKITVSPELAEKIYSISEDLKNEIPKLNSIKIIEDMNVSPDGTIVETPLSRVDSRLKTQIDQIAENLMSEHYSTIEDEIIEADEQENSEQEDNIWVEGAGYGMLSSEEEYEEKIGIIEDIETEGSENDNNLQ